MTQTNIPTIPELAVSTPPAPQAEQLPMDPEREERLRALLGMDYGYAVESGLVDMFEFNPDTGEDALTHTLAGDADAANIPSGFHHEESGQIWGTVPDETGGQRPATRVDREHLEGANSGHRRWYQERPAEPYLAQVAIGDRPKMGLTTGADGETRLSRTRNAMYPKEYDALAVMQAVRQAYEGADFAQARPGTDDRGRPVLVTEGSATLIDGVSKMPIRLVINPETKKIRTAIPLVKGKTGIMNLTEADMAAHMTYQTPTSSLRK